MTDWHLRRTFVSDQGRVAWDVMGDGEPLVLIHGTPFSSYIWRDVAPLLAPYFRVHLWDLAGYGESEMNEGHDVSLPAQSRILGQLLDEWNLDAPMVVGHDFGGAIALLAMLTEDRAFTRLVLADAVALRPWGTGFFQLAQQHSDILRQLPLPVHKGLVKGYIQWAAHHTLDEPTIERLAAPWSSEQGRDALYRQIIQNGPHLTDEVQDRYSDISIPTLIIWGEHDAWLPVDQAHQLHQIVPDSQLCIVADAGHLVPLDAPKQLADEVIRFFRQH